MEDRLRILALVAEALDYAHHQGVVHRDIKPGNVLLTAADSPKLSDFGLSILVEQGDESGVIRGTPLYMSPEQTRGGKLDFRSDLYSLGVMIYESAAGVAPFTGPSTTVMAQHASATPNPPRARNPYISEDLEALILSLMAKRPDDRPRSGSAVAESLRQEVDRLLRERQAGTTAASGMTATQESADGRAPSVAASTERRTPSGSDAVAVNGSGAGSGQGGSVATPMGAPDMTMASALARQPATAASPSPRAAAPARPSFPGLAATGGITVMVRSPLVRKMLETVLADPILLSPEERYLTGHYLAYLLSGSRRRGLLLRRPMEPRNADRARLLLGMTYAILAGSTEEAIRDAAALLDQRIDVRAALSPVVVAKYLAARTNSARRRVFRQTRKAIGQASPYAQKRMIDPKGVLNPGLMPQRLDDLHHIAPPRTDVDDVLVERWNRVAEVWRMEPNFRAAVLRYATSGAHRDPASTALWPEVVYPLIERARWHRRVRSRTEAVWDYLCARVLHVPDAGVVLDRAMHRSVPAPLVAHLDDSLDLLVESPRLEDEQADPFAAGRRGRSAGRVDLDQRQPGQPGRDRRRARGRRPGGRPAGRPRSAPLPPGGPPRALEGGLRRAGASPGASRGQAAYPPPRPGRPLSPDRHPLDPRPRRRPDRHPGHGPEADRAHDSHGAHQGHRRQAPRGHLGLPG